MRGLKIGINEIDLLATKHLGDGKWKHIHAEVQVSLRPVTYISGLTRGRQIDFNISGSRNATKRTQDQLEVAVKDWVHKKFLNTKKADLRKKLSNSDKWDFYLVHGKVKSELELELIKQNGITIISIQDVLKELLTPLPDYTTYAATDIIEMLSWTK